MRVGPYIPQNMNMGMNMQRPANQKQRVMQNQSKPMEPPPPPAMAMAQRVLSEQGEAQAGHFLYAIRPYVAPAELAFIEQRLNVQSKRDPNLDAHPEQGNAKSQKGGMDMQMLQMLMGLMNNKSKPDPMMLLKMMSGGK